ncbi:nitrate transporter [Sphingorhabdus pulchriflava]|uniref:Nitrate transporter n=1 Tax=Sphingorhabdus pulchriflava TaxID=2292257 RepID=A0A371BIJ7_9SPHN|nr:ABC transporter substrate-binding protein [Sphingorhabdus pulchriflava]RDV07424.1 nitrate transporter [Sphingorhabdus pulchriflava]
MTAVFRLGFLPLVDAALPILARELGFAEDEGLALDLVRDMSWATVQDRLLYGHSDAAHMVAPLAIATTLGLGRPAVPLSVPFVLGLNGNAITLRPDLAAQVTQVGGPGDVSAIGASFARVAMAQKAAGTKLRLGVVHRYSSHNYMLRYWLRGTGTDPNADVEIVTIAPPYAADALTNGEVDGICVGAPWNSVAVERGAGVVIATTSQIWRRGVEKVLAVKQERLEQERERFDPLLRALYRAGEAFVDPDRLEQITSIMARPEYLDGSADAIRRVVQDLVLFADGFDPVHIPDFMFQHREAANFPWVSQAAWLYAQMVEAGHAPPHHADYQRAQAVFRPDIYRSALGPIGATLPGASSKLEGGISTPTGVGSIQGRLILTADSFFDGQSFDPDVFAEMLPE